MRKLHSFIRMTNRGMNNENRTDAAADRQIARVVFHDKGLRGKKKVNSRQASVMYTTKVGLSYPIYQSVYLIMETVILGTLPPESSAQVSFKT